MTDHSEVNKTTKMVYFASLIKDREINSYESKVLELQKRRTQNPENRVIEYKYHLAKMRYEQLLQTTKDLRQLEQDIENLKKIKAS